MIANSQLVAVNQHERASAPTYSTAHRIISGDLTAPVEMIGWTILRALLIAPGLAIAGVGHDPKNGKRDIGKLALASLAGSSMVSLFAIWRSYVTNKARQEVIVMHGVPPYY